MQWTVYSRMINGKTEKKINCNILLQVIEDMTENQPIYANHSYSRVSALTLIIMGGFEFTSIFWVLLIFFFVLAMKITRV